MATVRSPSSVFPCKFFGPGPSRPGRAQRPNLAFSELLLVPRTLRGAVEFARRRIYSARLSYHATQQAGLAKNFALSSSCNTVWWFAPSHVATRRTGTLFPLADDATSRTTRLR